jgi:hypothetical protein
MDIVFFPLCITFNKYDADTKGIVSFSFREKKIGYIFTLFMLKVKLKFGLNLK